MTALSSSLGSATHYCTCLPQLSHLNRTLIPPPLSIIMKSKLNVYFQLEILVPCDVVAEAGGVLEGSVCVFLFQLKIGLEITVQGKCNFLLFILFVLCFSYAFVVYSISHEINLMYF